MNGIKINNMGNNWWAGSRYQPRFINIRRTVEDKSVTTKSNKKLTTGADKSTGVAASNKKTKSSEFKHYSMQRGVTYDPYCGRPSSREINTGKNKPESHSFQLSSFKKTVKSRNKTTTHLRQYGNPSDYSDELQKASFNQILASNFDKIRSKPRKINIKVLRTAKLNLKSQKKLNKSMEANAYLLVQNNGYENKTKNKLVEIKQKAQHNRNHIP